MNIDMSQFAAAFLDEAGENLTDLESGLLSLETDDNPDMNAIFRAAHSIKGGAGTFGFNAVADFTHVVESVLEKARDGQLEVTEELATELLKSVDVIGELLTAAREERDDKPEDHDRCLKALEAYMNAESGAAPASDAVDVQSAPVTTQPSATDKERIVTITFNPLPHLPQTGSDPINIIRELEDYGDVVATLLVDDLEDIDKMNPEEMHIGWKIQITTSASEAQLHDVFLFVEDDCELKIETTCEDLGFGLFDDDEEEVVAVQEGGDKAVSDTATATPMPERREGAERRKKTDRRAGGGQAAPPTSSFIRVEISKVDNLLNLVGELVTTNAMVTQSMNGSEGDQHERLEAAAHQMTQHTRSLQEAIMSIRMMPVDFVFNRFPRMVRDTATKLNKKVRLETEGAQTELDKTVIERITDPLTHLVRNSVDHGIELPEERVAAGKPEEGTVMLSAFYRGGSVVIEIKDDGKGLSRDKIVAKAVEKGLITEEEANHLPDEAIWDFIFNSGFSTAAAVTDVSGRGVGMDVVRKNIQSLGGSVTIQSEAGVGSCISVSLPLTLAILDAMATRVGDQVYLVPLLSILESIRPTPNLIKKVQDGCDVIDFRGEYLPLLRLSQVLQVPNPAEDLPLEQGIAVIVETDAGRIALFVDDLLGERNVVIKNIEDNYRAVEGLSGATIMGDGRVALIVDLTGLAKMAAREGRYLYKNAANNLSVAGDFGTFDDVSPQPTEGVDPSQLNS